LNVSHSEDFLRIRLNSLFEKHFFRRRVARGFSCKAILYNCRGWEEMQEQSMNETDKCILEKLRSLILERVRVHKIILFGSRARGDAAPDSDMDVLVILDETITPEVRDVVSDCAWKAGFDAGVVVASVVFTREEWEEGPEYHSPFVEAVRSEGIPV
jgi:uncharacterized protein